MSNTSSLQQYQPSNSAGNAHRYTIGDSQSTRSSCVAKRCSSANVVKCHQDEELVIEDLEPSLQSTCIDNSSLESLATAQSADSFSSRPPGDGFAPGDFIAYQGADLNAFFGEQLEPQRVSEVCLVNDHFILVKMPDSYGRHNSQMDCIAEEVSGSGSRDSLTVAAREDIPKRKHGRFGRYFRCKRNRRISPVQNQLNNFKEKAEPSAKMKWKCPVSYCWRANSDEHEALETNPKVSNISNARQSAGRVIDIEPKLIKPIEALDLSGKRLRIQQCVTTLANSTAPSANTPRTLGIESCEMQAQSDHGQLQTSQHDAVQLEQHVTLATPVKYLKTFPSPEKPAAGVQKPKPTRHLGAFHWLLKSLRSRSRKPKTKPKIHAVVYKTYFVRWTKSPDELCHGCGKAKSRQSASVDDVFRLRRSRSATF